MKTKISILSVLLCIGSGHLFADTNFDQQMSLQEKQQTGVVNLTLKQRVALAAWIDKNYNPKKPSQPSTNCPPQQAPAPGAPAMMPESAMAMQPQTPAEPSIELPTAPELPEYNKLGTVSISMVIMDGKQLSLSDDSRWLVYPQDVQIASLWLTPAIVIIKPGVDPDFNYYMTNTSTGQTIRVRKMAPGQTYENPVEPPTTNEQPTAPTNPSKNGS
ncbi:MAG: hypothetical protein FJZ57_04470 [Chlamydiae bacterium]|nr:hypothetical protein [Chlamydiota bacterium]